MEKAVIYIHGRAGDASEAEHYIPLFPDSDVIGFDYRSQTPQEAMNEFPAYFDALSDKYSEIIIIANSLGAYLALHSLADKPIKTAFFISPVADMEKVISGMMHMAGVSEDELREKKMIATHFCEVLSWDYLCYVRNHPIKWHIPTHILYGENDELTAYDTMSDFSERIGASLTVMPKGEHWFHTNEQMKFLDKWITDNFQI